MTYQKRGYKAYGPFVDQGYRYYDVVRWLPEERVWQQVCTLPTSHYDEEAVEQYVDGLAEKKGIV